MTAVTSAAVAIVVPSIHVDPLLVRCLRTCRAMYPDVTILALVDDDTGHEQVDDVAEVVATGPITIGAKRNMGAKLTESDHLAFIDSDAFPEAGWLEHAVAHLEADDGLGAVGGPNISPLQQTRSERYVGLAHHSPLVCGWWTYRKSRTSPARDVPALPSCNFVVRRIDYEALAGMNETLFTAEDTDFCRRLGLAGRRIRFEPDVVVFHKNRNLRSFVIQRYTFGVAMVPLVGKATVPDPAYAIVSLLPGALVAFLAAGPVALRSPRLRRAWVAATAGYAALLVVEGVRHAEEPRDFAGTSLALAIGNITPGLGIVLRAAGFSTDLRGIYRNYD